MQYDLIIVGGGVLGAFHAYFALQAGQRVLLLEKDAQPNEASVRNFGQVIPSGMAEGEWFDYGRVAQQTYLAIQARHDIGVRQNGALYLANTESELRLLEEKHAHYRALDYPCALLSPAQCRQRLPSLRPDYCRGGLHFPQEITAEPDRTIHGILAYLTEQCGLDYRPGVPVLRCEATDTGCDVTDAFGQHYQAARVIVCTGRDFQFLFPDVFYQSDLQVVKLQMLATYPLPHVSLPGSVLSGLSIRRYYAFKSCPSYAQLDPADVHPDLTRWGIHLLFKQALDGSIIIGDSHAYADVARAADLGYEVDDDVNQLILTEARRILDLPDWRIGRVWNGFYAQSKTGEIFTRVLHDRIHLVTGIGGKGMTTAAGFAQRHVAGILG